MIRAALGALLSHWWRRPFQLLTLILGLALATALWSGVQAINAEARSSYASAAEVLGSARPILTHANGGPIAQTTYVTLRRAGWAVSPVVEGTIPTIEGRVRLLGLDPLTAPRDSAAAGTALSGDPAAFLAPPGQFLAAPATADRLKNAGLGVIQGVDGVAPGMLFGDIGIVQTLLEMEDQISRLIVLRPHPKNRPDLTEIAPELMLSTPDTSSDLARLTDSFHLNLTAFGLLSFVVGLFIVNGTIGLAFEQRRPMFRTLRALGLSARALTVILCLELLAFALISGAIGIALGYLIAAALLPDVAATLRGLYGASVEGTLTLQPGWWAMGLGIAVLGTGVAAAGSLWKIARLPVLAPARPRAWAMASERALWLQAGASVGLLIFAVAAGIWGSGLVAGFAMLGALLLSAALALPVILTFVLGWAASFAKTPLAEWFWADTRQQLPGLSLALMALLLALAANIGVGTMVSSFRLTFTGWLDQRLASELYVTASDEAEGKALAEWLAPRSDAILPIWNVDRVVNGAPAEIYGVADHATYRDNWPLLDQAPDVWDVVAQGQGILINEQMARRDEIGVGDLLPLPGGGPLPIAGIYSDYGNPQAQILMNVDSLVARYPEVPQLRYGVRVAPENAAALVQSLVEDFGLSPDAMIDQAAIKGFSLDVFEQTFTVTGALNVLTLAVAGFAILTSLLTLAAMRLPQLAPVWALGMTRAGLAKLELARALFLAMLTMIAAVPVGLILAWVLLAVINVEAFGWRLPMHIFPVDWLILGTLALIAAGLASLWPSLKLARIPPSDLLKVFANER